MPIAEIGGHIILMIMVTEFAIIVMIVMTIVITIILTATDITIIMAMIVNKGYNLSASMSL